MIRSTTRRLSPLRYFARLQRNETGLYGRTKDDMIEHFADILAGLANRVPAGSDLLFHFCYGDSNHRHVVEPTDTADMVTITARLDARVKRPINLVHMPCRGPPPRLSALCGE